MVEPVYTSEHSNKERNKIVGDNLLMLRRRHGLSQKDICDYLMTSPQTYSGYETGKHEPNIETLVRLAFLYNVDMDTITGKWEGIETGREMERHFKILQETSGLEDLLKDITEQVQMLRERLAYLENKHRE